MTSHSAERADARQQYYLPFNGGDLSKTLWDAALEYLRPQLYLARIDMYPDLSDASPDAEFDAESIEAHRFLRTVSTPEDPTQEPRTWTQERLDLTVPEAFDAYKLYGYHSIETSVYRRDEPPESGEYPQAVAAISNHDQGYTLGLRLSLPELEELRPLLEEKCFPWELLERWEPPVKRGWFRRKK